MSCKTPDICKRNDLTTFCYECIRAIEEAAIQNALNFGIPEYHICGSCGGRYGSPTAYVAHFPCLYRE